MDNNLRFKIMVVVHIILILILVGLMFKIKLEEDNYNCSGCNIVFKSWQRFGKEKILVEKEFPIQELYKGYLNKDCPVKWSGASGYIIPTKLNLTDLTNVSIFIFEDG